MSAPRMVLIQWEDAKALADSAGWHENKAHAYDPHLVLSLGFVMLDDPAGMHITSDWHPDAIGPTTQIPRGMIRNITELTQKKARR